MKSSLGSKLPVSNTRLNCRELSLLKTLRDLTQVVQLICYDVVFSQEGVLLVLVMERGETNVSKYLLDTKCLSPASFLHLWEGILSCVSALNGR